MIRSNLNLLAAAVLVVTWAQPGAAQPRPPLPGAPPSGSPAPAPPASAAPASPSAAPIPAQPYPGVPSLPGPTAAPSAAAGATPTPSPTKTPNYTFRFVPKASPVPSGAPEILEVDLNSNVLKAKGDIDMRVLTSPNVVTVVSRSGGHAGGLAKVGDGEFVAAGKLPALPFFVGGVSFNLQFVASTQDGRSTSVTIPVKLR